MALKRKFRFTAAPISHASAEASARSHHIKLLSTKSDRAHAIIGLECYGRSF